MLLILRNFKVKIMSLLVFVIFLCPMFLPAHLHYLPCMGLAKSSKEAARTFLVPAWKVIQFQSIRGTDSGLLSPRPRIALGDLSSD